MKNVIMAIMIMFIIGGGHSTSNLTCDLTCETVRHDADRCLYYAIGTDNTILDECCQGLRRLKKTATSVEDKTTVCKCLSEAIESGDLPVKEDRMNDISRHCKVKAPFKLTTHLDCTKIN